MKHTESQPLTQYELKQVCNKVNRLHRVVWVSLSIIMAVCALIWNRGHLFTAALLLLVSRARWTVTDIEKLA